MTPPPMVLADKLQFRKLVPTIEFLKEFLWKWVDIIL